MTAVNPWKDHEGGELWASLTENGLLGISVESASRVEVADLEAFVSWLYKQAGRVPPVMLGRPQVDPRLSADAGPFRLRLKDRDLAVEVSGALVAVVDAVTWRRAAATGCALLDAAEARPEPDPEKVARLSAWIRESAPASTEDLAAALLRAGMVTFPEEVAPDA